MLFKNVTIRGVVTIPSGAFKAPEIEGDSYRYDMTYGGSELSGSIPHNSNYYHLDKGSVLLSGGDIHNSYEYITTIGDDN